MARSESKLPGGVRISDVITLGVLAESIPASDVQAAVAQARRQSQRDRSLPAEVTALYTVAMSLYRDVSLEEVLNCLVEGQRWLNLPVALGATKGAISQARARLGVEPMRLLFERLAHPLAGKESKGSWYRSWRTVVVDGTTFDIPDTLGNAGRFGYPAASRGNAAFPQIRCVALCETGTHAAFAAQMGPYRTHETTLFRELLPKLQEGMLLLADRGYFGFSLWNEAASSGADLLWRVKGNMRLDAHKRLSDKSFLSFIYEHPNDYRKGEGGVPVRVIEYQKEGSSEVYRLLTTILDPESAPALELAALYEERWEVELVFDEIKTHVKGPRLTLRSKTPDLVEQEFWGLMLAHRALRTLIHEVALRQKIDPDKISLTHTLRVVKRTMPSRAALSP